MRYTLMPVTTEFETIRQAMDRLINDAFTGTPFRTLWSRTWTTMPLDVYATDNEAVILTAVPGLTPENLDISVYKNTIVVSGKVGDYAEGVKNATWYLRELPHGEFRRSVTLPFPVDAEKAEAHYEHGVVRIVLPKAEAAKPRKIQIQAGEQPKAVEATTSAN
ncbi:MAG TPA: Hsp20/alpha crystallin family protein [Thermomicrobiales bacterium]